MKLIRFQSLLSWIGFRDSAAEHEHYRLIWFQSLLSWIGFRDSGTRANQSIGDDEVSILVVVDWVQRLVDQLPVVLQLLCFNPCCRGLGSETTSGP